MRATASIFLYDTQVGTEEAIVPYEKSMPLDVYGLKTGTCTVPVDSVSGSFEPATDNLIPN